MTSNTHWQKLRQTKQLSNRSNEEEIFVVQKELGGCIVDGKHVLFGALLALIASLIVCVEIILLF